MNAAEDSRAVLSDASFTGMVRALTVCPERNDAALVAFSHGKPGGLPCRAGCPFAFSLGLPLGLD
jgi:hypothetical protein